MDTHIYVILDRSGSMTEIKEDTIGGFNEWLEATAKGQKQGDDVRISITIFDTEVDRSVDSVPLRSCPKLGTQGNPFVPRGGTALLDAVGRTLSNVQKVKKGTRALAVIITDGHENSSREWTSASIGKLMGDLEASGRWSFVYLGAGVDAWDVARTVYAGTQSAQTTSYRPDQTRSAFRSNAAVTSAYLGGGMATNSALGAETQAKIDAEDEVERKAGN